MIVSFGGLATAWAGRGVGEGVGVGVTVGFGVGDGFSTAGVWVGAAVGSGVGVRVAVGVGVEVAVGVADGASVGEAAATDWVAVGSEAVSSVKEKRPDPVTHNTSNAKIARGRNSFLNMGFLIR